MKYDVFISHASEDKAEVARPLANRLIELGLRVWIDEFELTLGDSLRRKIDRGLAESRFGIIILSPNFFKKEWPKRELDGLFAREDGSEKVILPVWHKINRDDVISFSPTVADKLAVSTENSIEYVAQKVLEAVQRQSENSESQQQGMKLELQREAELAHIREDLLLSHSIRDLQITLYKTEEFLSKNPNFYQARLLKDEITTAIRIEKNIKLARYGDVGDEAMKSNGRDVTYRSIKKFMWKRISIFRTLLMLIAYLLWSLSFFYRFIPWILKWLN